jgi:hypothetical protein
LLLSGYSAFALTRDFPHAWEYYHKRVSLL